MTHVLPRSPCFPPSLCALTDTAHCPYFPSPASHLHFAEPIFWLEPIFHRNEVTPISFARSLHRRTITEDWMENLTQSQIRICANETAVLVTTMLSLKGSTVTVNGPVIFSACPSSLGQTQRLQVEIWPCFPRALFSLPLEGASGGSENEGITFEKRGVSAYNDAKCNPCFPDVQFYPDVVYGRGFPVARKYLGLKLETWILVHHFLAIWFWSSHRSFLCFTFFIVKKKKRTNTPACQIDLRHRKVLHKHINDKDLENTSYHH